MNAFIGWLFLLSLALLGVYFMLHGASANGLSNSDFDHSICQYPERSTNPVNGCDNSDPCDPNNVKGGSGECITQTTVDVQKSMSQNVYITNEQVIGK